jgi:hypothetical protein
MKWVSALKGFRTVAFGLVVAVAPAAVTYLGGVDWTTLGISPGVAGALGLIVVGLRAITTTAVGQK